VRKPRRADQALHDGETLTLKEPVPHFRGQMTDLSTIQIAPAHSRAVLHSLDQGAEIFLLVDARGQCVYSGAKTAIRPRIIGPGPINLRTPAEVSVLRWPPQKCGPILPICSSMGRIIARPSLGQGVRDEDGNGSQARCCAPLNNTKNRRRRLKPHQDLAHGESICGPIQRGVARRVFPKDSC